MPSSSNETFRIREFTRREKTSIRQDVKRFEKIGRDHHCHTLEDYADFVRQRLQFDEDGGLALKSANLLIGLISYFGDQLIRTTQLERIVTTHEPAQTSILRDPGSYQTVLVSHLIVSHIFRTGLWGPTLDDLFDELVDWNYGHLDKDDLQTTYVWDPEIGLSSYLAA